eukprot:COSAG02_NODE_64342_length_260_cov_9.701863_1_plen_68_part_01
MLREGEFSCLFLLLRYRRGRPAAPRFARERIPAYCARYAYVKRVADDERTAMLNGGKIAVGSSRRLRH